MVKATAGAALMKRLENERAMKGVALVTSMFGKVPTKPAEDGAEELAAAKKVDIDAVEGARLATGRNTPTVPDAGAAAVGSPEQGLEPPGTQEGEEEKEEDGEQEPSPKPAPRRRVVAMSDDEDEVADEGASKSPDKAAAIDKDRGSEDREGEDKEGEVTDQVPSGDYIQGVSVVDGDVGSDSEADKAASNAGSSSEEDEEETPSAETGKKVRLEDFEDEEEFLVAGGNVEDAMTRKEWGLSMRAETQEEDEDTGPTKEERTKMKKDEQRKMYRESEKLMREKRCLIKPAVVAKRSFKDLRAKVDARVSMVAHGGNAPVDAPSANEQGEQADPAPLAPKSAVAAAAPSKPLAMDEDEDDDDDELIIRGNTVPSTPLQLPRVGVSMNSAAATPTVAVPLLLTAEGDTKEVMDNKEKQAESRDQAKSPKKGTMPSSKPPLNIMSPPKARKLRVELRNQLMRTAQSRSEHLMTAVRSGIKVKRDMAPPNFSREMDLDSEQDPFPNLDLAFIASAKYVGHKGGYVFHMGERGLGYYKDGEEKGEEEEEEEDFFDGVEKKKKVRLATKDDGLEDSDDEMQEPTKDAVTPATHLRNDAARKDENMAENGGQGAEGEHGENGKPGQGAEGSAQADEDKTTVEKPKERTSIFKSFVGIEEGRELMETQVLDSPAIEPVVVASVSVSTATVPVQPSLGRKYGQNGIAAMLRKQQDVATAKAATLLPEKVHGPVKVSTVEWREPNLEDSDEDDCEGDDEADEAENDEEEEEEDEDEDEDEDEEEDQQPAKKKSLNDVVSIKKNTLRLGTLDAGYLRTEENAMGYHDDVGVAKEDMEDGIDLMDTDNEDAEEEDEDSEEERRVAEGFIEDAAFAETLGLNPEELQEFYQKQREEMDEKENERILDVIRGDARRRKAAGQGEDNWVPNRAARQRGMALGQVPVGFSGAMLQSQEDELEEGMEGDPATQAARAAERIERLKWLQERKQLEVEEAQAEIEQEQEGAEADARVDADTSSRATIRRHNSRAGPSLSAFSRQLSGVYPATSSKAAAAGAEAGGGDSKESGDGVHGAGNGASRWRKVNSVVSLLRKSNNSMLGSGSLRGSGGQQDTPGASAGKEKEKDATKIGSSKAFFFETMRAKKDDDNAAAEPPTSNLLPLPPGASIGSAPKKSTTSSGAAFTTKRKASGAAAPMKRQKSTLLSALTE